MSLRVSRNNLLNDSINEIESYSYDFDKLYIYYIDEEGSDEGGLLRDWFTSVTKELKEYGAFKSVPGGHYYTINENCEERVIKFVGQLIALAINNECNVNIKFASFIWKLFLNEEITLEDMEEYDHSIYQSLNWILNNNVDELDETFVDRNDEELIENGKNIKLTNDNKNKYVELIVKKTLMPCKNAFDLLVNGFNEILLNKLNISPKLLRDTVNGQEKIDLVDWKENTICFDDDIIDDFFEILSNWDDENLRKLLKFATGSSVVPINGFADLEKNGGQFTIEIDREEMLPEAHTCFNTLVLPKKNDIVELENKLLLAIEVVDFGIL